MEVDAIEDNKIVRVTQEYVRLHGLLIIRKIVDSNQQVQPVPIVQLRRSERRAKPQLEEFRKPLDYSKNNVIKELKDNFQWEISRKRRVMNLSRRQLASMVGESEDQIINLENGFLPEDNFVLLNKVEKVLGISVRKIEQSNVSLKVVSEPQNDFVPIAYGSREKVESSELSGEEIELD